MGQGLVTAGGLQGGYATLDQIMQDRLLQQKMAEAQQQRAFENSMKERQAAQGDRELELRAQAQAPQPTSPEKPMLVGPGYTVYDPTTKGALYTAPDKPAPPQAPPAPTRGININGRLVDPTNGKVLGTFAPQETGGSGGGGKGATPTPEISPYQAEHNTRTRESVDALLKKVSRRTSGIGSVLANLPETDARNFRAEMDTLKANIGFSELTAMREASKTGGALGQVSDRELQLLSSALGALDQGQSPENLRTQLQKIRDSLDRWEAAKASGGGLAPMKPVPSHAPTGAHPPASSGFKVTELP